MAKELSESGEKMLTGIGEKFGNDLAKLVSPLRTQSVTIISIDEERSVAMVELQANVDPAPVPLSMFGGMIKAYPNPGSVSLIAYMNGDDTLPLFLQHSQIDKVEFIRGATSLTWQITPPQRDENGDEQPNDPSKTNDDILLKVDNSVMHITKDVIQFNGGELDGLVKINELTTKLNALVDAYNAHTHSIPAGTFLVGAQAGVPNPAPVTVPKIQQAADKFVAEDYKNEKITQ